MLLLSLFMFFMLLNRQIGQATPLPQPQVNRRETVACSPVIPSGTALSFRHCINAIHLMSPAGRHSREPLVFGRGPGVDVQIINGDSLKWDYGTFFT